MIYPLRNYARAWYRGAEMASMFVSSDKVWTKPFTPLWLFANGEQGAWFDPRDLTLMFQSAAGRIPAAYGQPVGLMLDKSKGAALGPELVTVTRIEGQVLDGPEDVPTALSGAVVSVGKTYRIAFTASGYSGVGDCGITSGSFGQQARVSSNGNYVIYGKAEASSTVAFFNRKTNTVIFDGISIREVSGNHARQPTAMAQPTLMQSGAVRYLYRDPVDDALPWTAPAGSYDIVHIPLTGPATVLTAQSLSGAANILLGETTRAYIAIDRRLTAAEIDALDEYYGEST